MEETLAWTYLLLCCSFLYFSHVESLRKRRTQYEYKLKIFTRNGLLALLKLHFVFLNLHSSVSVFQTKNTACISRSFTVIPKISVLLCIVITWKSQQF